MIKQSYAMFANLVDIVNMTYANVFHNSFGHYNATTKKWTGHSESLRSGASNYSGIQKPIKLFPEFNFILLLF